VAWCAPSLWMGTRSSGCATQPISRISWVLVMFVKGRGILSRADASRQRRLCNATNVSVETVAAERVPA
jgi:hypothetical protein